MAPPASSTFRAPPLEGRGAASASTGSVGPADPVAAARAGDMQAWAQLYQENFDRIYRRLCYLVGRSADAEDLTHETFARAVVGLASFDGRSSFSTTMTPTPTSRSAIWGAAYTLFRLASSIPTTFSSTMS